MTDQPTTDDLLFPLLQEARDEDSLDITDEEIRDGHHRIEPFVSLARKAFDLGIQHAERKRFVAAPPVDTTPLDDAIIDHLTRAQRHWLVGVDRAGAPDFTAHMEHYINRTRVAFLLVAFRAFMPSVATTVAAELTAMLNNPPVGAMWVWEQLVDNGIDPSALTAFSPPKPREEDAHPLRYASTAPDGQVVTGSILDEIAAERARQVAKWGEQNHPDGDPIILGRLADGGPFGSPEAVALRLADHYEIPSATRAKYICDTEAKFGGRTWPSTAVEELAEVVEATTEGRGRTRGELIQLGAVIVAWVESIDRAVEADIAAMPIVEPVTATVRPADGTPAELSGKQDGTAPC